MADNLNDLQTQLYLNTRALGESKARMDASKVGSPEYKAAKKIFDKAKAAIPGLESKIKKLKETSEKTISDKKTADKLTKLQEKRQRLIDQGQSTKEVDAEIEKLQPKNASVTTVPMESRPFGGQPILTKVAGDQTVTPDITIDSAGNKKVNNTSGNVSYKGKGTDKDPLTKNGSPFTGTYQGKKYNNGVIVKADEDTGLTTKQEATLGTYGSKYLLEYFKANYPTIYNKLIDFAKVNESPANVEGFLRNTAWYKDVNQRVNATVGSYALSNGITLTQEQQTNFRDQLLAKVKDREEINYDIRLMSIEKFQLDTVKPDIARAMRAGLDFNQAAADYIEIYRTNFQIAASQFTVNDQLFQTLLTKATDLSSFTKELRRTDKYLSQPQVQQQLNANKLMVQTKYRQYGLSITEEAASNLAKNVFLGDSSNEQIDENLRQQAIAAFPAFRDRILNGESPLSIASPYIQAMTRILEIPEGGLDLEDSTIRRAMQGKAITDAKGNTTSYETVPLWMFEQGLYKDSRWQYTSNARSKADTITLQLKEMLGL